MKKKNYLMLMLALMLCVLFQSNSVNAQMTQPTEIFNITDFAEIDESCQRFYTAIENKPSEAELLQAFPEKLEVYLDHSRESTLIDVSWYCVGGGYEETNYYYYQFSPKWDESSYQIAENVNVETDFPYISVYFIHDSVQVLSTENDSNETMIYEFLTKELGLNAAASCGALANIYCESSFSPTAKCVNEDGKVVSYGICQWTSGEASGNRYGLLKEWCKSNGFKYKTLEGQLNYMKHELETISYYRLSELKEVENSAEGAASAALIWAKYYEGCSPAYYTTRENLAVDTYWPAYSDKDDSKNEDKPEIKKGKVVRIAGMRYQIKTVAGEKEGKVILITGAKKSNVKIPATVKIRGKIYKVTEIGEKAFYGNKEVTTVRISKNVQKIGKKAFARCSKLKDITVKTTKLKSVGKYAFYGVHKSAKIRVPAENYKEYKKLMKNKGQGRKVRIVKY